MMNCDLISFFEEKDKENTIMLAQQLCHKFLTESLSCIHQKRVKTIKDMTLSLLNNSDLTLTSIGRHLEGPAKVKNKIKRVDRFLGNERVYDDKLAIYSALASHIFQGMPELFIFVDWSGCCCNERHMIRASVMYQGRSINLYNEVYNKKDMETEQTHGTFLDNLKAVIPEGTQVTIITDAGFKTPWFQKVRALGWHFAGRVRGRIAYCLEDEKAWKLAKQAHHYAKLNQVVRLGKGQLGKRTKKSLKGHFFVYKAPSKGRKTKKIIYPDHEKKYKALNSEPWVLFSSCEDNRQSALHVMKVYRGRMQIEQNFRDDKSERLGMGLRYSGTKDLKRLSLLLLLATITMYLLWWIGMTSERRHLHWDFQANTIRHRRVISIIFLAKQIIRHCIHMIKMADCIVSLHDFRNNYESLVLC